MKIPIKKYVDDPSLSWEERYRRLDAHHVEETQFLIKYIAELEKKVLRLKSDASWAASNEADSRRNDWK